MDHLLSYISRNSRYFQRPFSIPRWHVIDLKVGLSDPRPLSWAPAGQATLECRVKA